MESGVSLRTNVKQSRVVGNGLPRLTARNDGGGGRARRGVGEFFC